MQDSEVSQSEEEALWQKEEILLEKYSSKPNNLEVYEFQVSGKTPKFVNNTNGTIYKQYSQSEHQFYEFIAAIPSADPRASIKAFLPEYCGVSTRQLGSAQVREKQEKEEEGKEGSRSIWLDHIASRSKSQSVPCTTFILLKNLTFGYGIPNIMDLKLGIKKPKKTNIKFEKSTTNSHKFRINGLMVGLKEGETYSECFVSKYHGQKITVEETESYLALFFFNGEIIHKDLLSKVILLLQDLHASLLNFKNVRLISSSLFLAYDAQDPSRFTVNLIDFDKYEHTEGQEDSSVAQGVSNVRKFLISVLQNNEVHLQRLLSKSLDIFQKEHQVIPQEVMQKYGQ